MYKTIFGKHGRAVAFWSYGKLGLMTEEEGDPQLFDLNVPGETEWQFGPEYREVAGQRKIILHSHRKTAMKDLVIGNLTRRIWTYDWESAELREIFTGRRPADWMGVTEFLDGGSRAVVNAIIDGEQRLFLADVEHETYDPITLPGWGFHYCESLSPDQKRIAWHVTHSKFASIETNPYMPSAYSINVMNLATRERALIAGKAGHLYFGPQWSPDGRRLTFLDCHSAEDPAHFWADICVAEADGSSLRVITTGQSHWFATSYGHAHARGGGSNITAWAPAGFAIPTDAPKGFGDHGLVSHTCRLPGSHPDVTYDNTRPDHEEFVFKPDDARGGTHLRLLDPDTAAVYDLTPPEEGRWDFRLSIAPAGDRILFSRARPGAPAELWIMDADGSNPRFLTRGFEDKGADFGRWLTF